ncbi:MAG: DNA polymerase III subunit delta [Acholeplasmataceae bacterium]
MQELIHVFKGKNLYFVKQAIESHIKTLNVDNFNILKYDLDENNGDDVLEELQTIAFFADLKIVILTHIENFDLLTEGEQKQWIKYFKNPNPDVILIIQLNATAELSSTLKDLILSYTYIEEIKDLNKEDYPTFILNRITEASYKMDLKAIEMLLNRTNYDFDLIEQELIKLKIYKTDEKEILEQDVLSLVPRNLEDNIFELTNAMIERNNVKTIEIYEDLVAQNEDPLRILNFIANKMRELFHARLLLQKGFSKDEIATHFGYSSGRTYYLIKNASSQSLDQLETHLKKLSQLDYEIKSGLKDKKLGLELYLLGA